MSDAAAGTGAAWTGAVVVSGRQPTFFVFIDEQHDAPQPIPFSGETGI
jgi:hypothetical protein